MSQRRRTRVAPDCSTRRRPPGDVEGPPIRVIGVRFGVLGPLLVENDGGEDVAPGSPTQRTVLACLLARPGSALRADALIDAVWGAVPPASAEASLRTYISRLRGIVGDRLVRTGTSYRLDLTATDELDADRFEAELGAAADADDLGAALALWRGEAFADFAEVAPIEGQARRLDELHVATIDRRLGALHAEGRSDEAIAEAEAHVAAHPLRERAWTVLVGALAAVGRSGEAVRAYQRAAEALADAGLEPSLELRAAERVALGTERPPVGATLPMPVAVSVPLSVVDPAPGSTGLIGRDADLEQVEAMLAEHRLVTLHGPGGVGKTRLARAVGERWPHRRATDVFVVPLARIDDGEAVEQAIVDAAGITSDDGSMATALARVAGLDALLVLDNCEHVIDDVADAVEQLAGPAARVTVLCTSRERLAVPGEHSWSVAPLPTDGAGAFAVQLFIERLAAQRGDPTITDEERTIIGRIAHRLDGLPLAIEMAAARARNIALSELDAAIADRLEILRAGARRADPRHRTLRAVIEWSEDLLDEHERDVFRDLAVFAGPVPLVDIEPILDRPALLGTLSDLVDRSLVVATADGPTTTFRLLQTVRQHIRESGHGPDEALASRHTDHYIELARGADSKLRSGGEADAAAQIAGATAELRAVHRRELERSMERAAAVSAALHLYAVSRSNDEMQRWADEVVAHDISGPDAVLCLTTSAYRANNQGRYDDARHLATRALELAAGDPIDRFAHEVLSDTALYNGDIDAAIASARRLLESAERADDPYAIAAGYCGLVLPLAYSGRRDEALAELERVDPTGWGPSATAWIRYSYGEVLLDNDPDEALGHLLAAAEIADAVDARFLAGVARVSASSLLSRHGDADEALRSFMHIVEHWRTHRQPTHQITTLRNLVVLFDRLADHAAATRLLGVIEAADGPRSFGEEAELLQRVTAAAQVALGNEYDAEFAHGASLDLDAGTRQAVDDMHRLLDPHPRSA